ncbi:molybdate ABC transporter substrate-binding protein [Demequina aestuarii]|uniref:molybdate ABC transporter substrate-binding protein n=1 Tax=Demequina aestuarii TaxID=327095 RepID=UPI0007832F88|nr:molybdate ABC transporter substrate-binding protein [Demequina aestuarii]
MRRASAAAVGALVATGIGACGAPAEPAHTLTVYAAASLTDVFARIEEDFETAHPDVEVTTVYGGSTDLAAQIAEGAPADVFASAHLAPMEAIADELDATPVPFATNTLTIAVPTGNPAHVTSLADLAHGGVSSVICAPQVPCGTATSELAAAQGMQLMPSSEESSVTDVLNKVASGHADAGVVYATDIARATGVEEVAIAGAGGAVNTYPIAALAGARDGDLAASYVRHVVGTRGQEILASAGFGAP